MLFGLMASLMASTRLAISRWNKKSELLFSRAGSTKRDWVATCLVEKAHVYPATSLSLSLNTKRAEREWQKLPGGGGGKMQEVLQLLVGDAILIFGNS